LANALSVLRIALVPFIIYSLQQPQEQTVWWTLVLMATAALSDLADGFIARRFNQVSRTGRILDPLADKIFLMSVGFALVLWREFPTWLLLALLLRDLGIVIAGAFLLGRRDTVVSPNRIGKNTTAALVLTAVSFVLDTPDLVRVVLVWICALFLFLSSASYVQLLRTMLGGKAPPKEDMGMRETP
jgi:cardiolipin synthase